MISGFLSSLSLSSFSRSLSGEAGWEDGGGADLGFRFAHRCLTAIMNKTRMTMITPPPPTAADIAPDIWKAVLGRSVEHGPIIRFWVQAVVIDTHTKCNKAFSTQFFF